MSQGQKRKFRLVFSIHVNHEGNEGGKNAPNEAFGEVRCLSVTRDEHSKDFPYEPGDHFVRAIPMASNAKKLLYLHVRWQEERPLQRRIYGFKTNDHRTDHIVHWR